MDGINSENFKELKSPGYNLYIGSGDSDSVLALQKQLNKWGYTDGYGRPLAEDGIYGKNTYNAVIKYQRDNGLTEDGIAGDKTWGSMSDRMRKEEDQKKLSSIGKTKDGFTPLYEKEEKDKSPAKVAPEKSEKTKSGKKANVFGAFYSYMNARDGLSKNTYTDGYVESELQRIERQGGIEDNTLKQEEEWVKAQMEDMVRNGDYTNAYLAGYYGN